MELYTIQKEFGICERWGKLTWMRVYKDLSCRSQCSLILRLLRSSIRGDTPLLTVKYQEGGSAVRRPSWLRKGDWMGLERKTKVLEWLAKTMFIVAVRWVTLPISDCSRETNPDSCLESRPGGVCDSCIGVVVKWMGPGSKHTGVKWGTEMDHCWIPPKVRRRILDKISE